MIRLTRLRNAEALYLNPDQIERLDRHHETVVLMSNGTEYIVTEDAETIIDLIVAYRGRVLAAGERLSRAVELVADEIAGPAVELAAARTNDSAAEQTHDPTAEPALEV